MAKLNKNLKGSTLIEVIVAMVIILTCSALALSIMSNLSRDINDELRICAEIRINTVAEMAKYSGDFTKNTINFENIYIQQNILPFPGRERLRILHIEAFTPNGRKITEYKEIISMDLLKK